MNNTPDYENNLAFAPETEQDLINKAVNDCMIANIKLLEENKKLKDLLEECKEIIEWYKQDCGYQDKPTDSVLARIDEVLK